MLAFLVELAVIATLSFHSAGSLPAGTQQQAPSGPPTIERFPGLVVTEEPEAVDMPGRLAQVDAAIRCRIEFSEVIAVPDPNSVPSGADPKVGAPFPVTQHTVTVLEVIKPDLKVPAAGGSLMVAQPVGTVDWKGYKVKVVAGKFRPFAAGEEYVLLLEWNAGLSMYYATANDSFRLAHGVVDTPGDAEYTRKQAGAEVAAFMRHLRTAAAAAAQKRNLP